MPDPEPIQSLGLNATPPNSQEVLPAAESLQFRRAEHAPEPGSGPQCASCKQPAGSQYFQANGKPVCERCAGILQSTQNVPPNSLLIKGFFFGLGAAIAGSILYATVAIVFKIELALISILIGWMVAKAIRHAAGGGRAQQIMAVALTYLSITSSYVPVAIYQYREAHAATVSTASDAGTQGESPSPPVIAIGFLLGLALAAPFMSLASVGGLLSLLIIFFGLQRAWRLTARPHIAISGPYSSAEAT